MAIIFSENSGLNDDLFKDADVKIRSIMLDADQKKNKYDDTLNAMFNVQNSERFAEKQSSVTEFSNFEIVPEGGNAIQDEIQQGFNKLIIHEQLMKNFTVTKTMLEDNQFPEVRKNAMSYVNSYKRSRLDEATALLTGATATSVTWGGKALDTTTGDGKALFATDHPYADGSGAQSNVFTNAFGSDDTVLFGLANIGNNFKNQSGHKMDYEFDTLMIPSNVPAIERLAKKIIASDNQVGNDYNDVNVSKGKWKLIVNPLWTVDPTAKVPYIIMSSEANRLLNGNMFYDRVPLTVDEWIDHGTANLNFTGRYRVGCGFNIWQHIILGGAAAGTNASV